MGPLIRASGCNRILENWVAVSANAVGAIMYFSSFKFAWSRQRLCLGISANRKGSIEINW